MRSTSTRKEAFRLDINGLRAWAVVAVILYHFGVPGFSGGFIGVDVFFVISGFLMTSIIVKGLDHTLNDSGFSLVGFYLARARRILPALIVLCAVLLGAGWFTLSMDDYKKLGTHAIASLAFISNIQFGREAGYFDAASHDKWLLHTWSLSVEWQFYLILPLALMSIWKISPGRRSATVLLAAGFLASLILSIVLSYIKPTAAFFLLPARAWEMLAGGLVFLYAAHWQPSTGQRKSVERLGLGLITASILLFSPAIMWPGFWAVVPVAGAVLILISAREHSIWTGTPLAQWLGTCSYSLYLWHWPVVVALAYFELQDDAIAIAVGLALTLLLGGLSYALIENPSRRQLQKVIWQTGMAGLAAAAFSVAAPALAVRMTGGGSDRLSPAKMAVFAEANNKNPRMDECLVAGPTKVPQCTYGGPDLGVIVMGDSHAATIMRSVEKSLPSSSMHVLDWSMASCPPLVGVKKQEGKLSPNCGEFVEWAIRKQSDLPANVPLIIHSRLSLYAFGANEVGREKERAPQVFFDNPVSTATPEFLEKFSASVVDTACRLAQTRLVYMMRPIPEMRRNVPKVMASALILGVNRDVYVTRREYDERHAFVWAAQNLAHDRCGIRILDPLPYLCDADRCYGSKNGRPLYFDDDHLSEYGAEVIRPVFYEVFATTLTAGKK